MRDGRPKGRYAQTGQPRGAMLLRAVMGIWRLFEGATEEPPLAGTNVFKAMAEANEAVVDGTQEPPNEVLHKNQLRRRYTRTISRDATEEPSLTM